MDKSVFLLCQSCKHKRMDKLGSFKIGGLPTDIGKCEDCGKISERYGFKEVSNDS